mmetsp:Transcript_2707/g.3791  ORF Transcript_2707/g.3791 Transcript_2707/m.3791 type:complete len:95 (-) Transcript_2707:136-420(-)
MLLLVIVLYNIDQPKRLDTIAQQQQVHSTWVIIMDIKHISLFVKLLEFLIWYNSCLTTVLMSEKKVAIHIKRSYLWVISKYYYFLCGVSSFFIE